MLALPNEGGLVKQELATARYIGRQGENQVLESRIITQQVVQSYLQASSKLRRPIVAADECFQHLEKLRYLIVREILHFTLPLTTVITRFPVAASTTTWGFPGIFGA
jgi:hypothetical protein